MRKSATYLLLIIFVISACNQTNKKEKTAADIKKEIQKTEKDFETTVKDLGIAEAFFEFADENAVILRENDSIISGRDKIKAYYQNPKFLKTTVSWKPDFIEVSNDATLAYTYGKYLWTTADSSGKVSEFRGVFHTVWKKQSNGKWKYVWD